MVGASTGRECVARADPATSGAGSHEPECTIGRFMVTCSLLPRSLLRICHRAPLRGVVVGDRSTPPASPLADKTVNSSHGGRIVQGSSRSQAPILAEKQSEFEVSSDSSRPSRPGSADAHLAKIANRPCEAGTILLAEMATVSIRLYELPALSAVASDGSPLHEFDESLWPKRT